VETERAVATAEHLGLGWLARLGRAALAIAGAPAGAEYARSDARAVREAAGREDDRWGEGLAALAEGWAALPEPDEALEPLESAAAHFRALGAGCLEAWARSLAAIAAVRANLPDARETALAAEAVARSAGVAVSQAVAHRALAEADPTAWGELGASAAAQLADAGLVLPGAAAPTTGRSGTPARGASGSGSPGVPPAEIRLFGSFSMSVAGRPIDVAHLKPRPRALLRYLALHAGQPVHREVLQETFWPATDGATGARSLHVALSAIRRELAPGADRGSCDMLVREGDAYRLCLPDGAQVDLARFDDAVARARRVRGRGAAAAVADACRAVIAAYGGDLLPEDGPAEWASACRDRARAEVVDAARGLAEVMLEHDPAGAAEACATGLALDPYHDPLWRLLVIARERAGDQAAAAGARSGYARMLAELGVEPTPAA
jgi:DNA-binding SARP family transcriptional activator